MVRPIQFMYAGQRKRQQRRYFTRFIDLTFHSRGRDAALRLFWGRRSFLVRVTACTSVFVVHQWETWHGVINGYVDRVSVPYSDLNLIGCPCNRGFVPLVMYSPQRRSETCRRLRKDLCPDNASCHADSTPELKSSHKIEPGPVADPISSLSRAERMV